MVRELDFQTYSDRLPPQNIEAEESILGGILLDPEAISRVSEVLRPDAFYISAHKEIYNATLDLHAKGTPTDLINVTAWLRDRDKLEKIGGQSKLAQLVDRTVSAVNIDKYAALVMDKYLRRHLIKSGNEIVQLGYETTTPLETVLDTAEQKIFSITQERPQQDLIPIRDTLIHTFEDIEVRHEDQALPGLLCDFYDLDAMTGGFQRSDLIIMAGRPSMGKCLHERSQILLSDGRLVSIQQLYERGEEENQLLTLGKDWKFHFTRPSDFIDDGIKPVFRVKTRLGRQIETTLTHPYLTFDGWRSLAKLKPGNKIAVPRQLPVFGERSLPEHQVKLLAYFIGDGTITGGQPRLTNTNSQIQEEFAEAVHQNKPNELAVWLQSVGLWGENAHHKLIPDIVFQLKRSQLALFLNRLFSTDGWASVLSSGQAQIGYATVSETLARQIQHLLLRFGIIASLKQRRVKYDRAHRTVWQIDMTHQDSIRCFVNEIGIFGKAAAVDCVKDTLTKRRNQSNRDLIPVEVWEHWASLARKAGIQSTRNLHVGQRAFSRSRLLAFAKALENDELQNLANSEVYWDEIVAIEYIGDCQVYDLTIPDTHNFVANDICVHNTAIGLNIARNLAANYNLPVSIFSLEMSKEQLVQRLLASEARIESNRLRAGRISQNEWEPLSQAIGSLAESPIFIDDTPNITVTEMRSKTRRLQAEQGKPMGLVLLDYLQLMEGTGDNRVQELSRITRSLKGLARELNVPVIALSQLSRGVEARTNKRPMMSDLRECVTGDTLVWLADGRRLPIAELVGQTPEVVSSNRQGRLVKAQTELIWCVGTKPIYEITTASGRKLKATGQHRLYTLNGWKQVREFQVGDRLATAKYMPRFGQPIKSWTDTKVALLAHLIGDGSYLPRQPLRYTTASEENSEIVKAAAEEFGCTVNRHSGKGNWHQLVISGNGNRWHPAGVGVWLKELGIFGQRSAEKRVPAEIFQLSEAQIALFLKHLWATDGCISSYYHPNGKKFKASIFLSTVSEGLGCDVVALLLRLGISSQIKWTPSNCYTVQIYGKNNQLRFLEVVGAFGPRVQPAVSVKVELLQRGKANPNRDTLPIEVFELIKQEMKAQGISQRQMAQLRGTSYGGSSHFSSSPSRDVVLSYADLLDSSVLREIATTDLYWDEIVAIAPAGEATVYDLTVPETASWMANGIVSHNSGSIEQDADLIVMLYRDEYYNPDTPDRGIAEAIVSKHRNGPTGVVKLLFEPQFTNFKNLARSGY